MRQLFVYHAVLEDGAVDLFCSCGSVGCVDKGVGGRPVGTKTVLELGFLMPDKADSSPQPCLTFGDNDLEVQRSKLGLVYGLLVCTSLIWELVDVELAKSGSCCAKWGSKWDQDLLNQSNSSKTRTPSSS